jgi:hypothetical protein
VRSECVGLLHFACRVHASGSVLKVSRIGTDRA